MDEFNNQNLDVVYEQPQVDPGKAQKSGFAIASLVLGITSIFPGCCCGIIPIGIVLGILAIVFAMLFLKANKQLLVGKGMAIAGLILGIIGVLICTVMFIIGIANISSGYNSYDINQIIEEFEKGFEEGMDQ